MRGKAQGKCWCSEEKKVSFHPARIQPNSDLAPFEDYYQRRPFLSLSIFSTWQKAWKIPKMQLFQLNGIQINVWESSLWGTQESNTGNPTQVHKHAHKSVRGNYRVFGRSSSVSSYADSCYPRWWKPSHTHALSCLCLPKRINVSFIYSESLHKENVMN